MTVLLELLTILIEFLNNYAIYIFLAAKAYYHLKMPA